MFMQGLIMQALGGPLIKMRGRDAWLEDFRNALRSERKGVWSTNQRRVCQLLRSLETNLPWRTMAETFREQRVPLLNSIKVSSFALEIFCQASRALAGAHERERERAPSAGVRRC
jgi:hypothetical protein